MYCLKTIKLTVGASILLAFFLPNNAYAKSGFLTYPFKTEHELMQGWVYDFSNKLHQGVDYYSQVGEEVLATADGNIHSYYQPGKNFVFGKYVVQDHNNGYKTLYAHLSKINCTNFCSRGAVIALSGMTGTDNPHLHFETLSSTEYGSGLNRGYGWRVDPFDLYSTKYYYPPNQGFRALGRNHLWQNGYPSLYVPPPEAQVLAIAQSGKNGADLTWDEATRQDFDRYELVRSGTEGGTGDKVTSEIMATYTDPKILKHSDTNLFAAQDYYYRIYTYYKNGQIAISNEVTINIPREIKNVSNMPGTQRFVGISRNKVFWESTARERDTFPQRKTLYYYNIDTDAVESLTIGDIFDNRIGGPNKPQIAGDWLCFAGQKSSYGNSEIFCRNLAADMVADIQITNYNGDDSDVQVTEAGIATWEGGYSGARRVYWTNLNGGPVVNQVTDLGGNQSQPRISGNNIIWIQQTAVGAQKDLYYKNIETGAQGLVVSGIGAGTVDIWEDSVIYKKDGVLMLSDLSGQNTEPIISAVENARMRDGKIVYTKANPGGKYSVCVHVIATGKTITVAESLKYQPVPFVYENLVAFDASITNSSTDMEIFLTNL